MLSKQKRFETEILIPRPVSQVFPFFAEAKNLEKITPPWLRFQILWQSDPQIKEGTEFKYQLKIKGFPVKWHSRIIDWNEGKQFTDIQLKGPYSKWEHQHLFEERDQQTWMKDIVDYSLPFGVFGHLVAGRWVERDVRQIFEYRTQVIRELFR